jgi:hypothetical protein
MSAITKVVLAPIFLILWCVARSFVGAGESHISDGRVDQDGRLQSPCGRD